jgi:hypothetical protein
VLDGHWKDLRRSCSLFQWRGRVCWNRRYCSAVNECARDCGGLHLLRTAGPKSIHYEVKKEFKVERRVLDAPKLCEVELLGCGRRNPMRAVVLQGMAIGCFTAGCEGQHRIQVGGGFVNNLQMLKRMYDNMYMVFGLQFKLEE